jgi:hypothetical protein
LNASDNLNRAACSNGPWRALAAWLLLPALHRRRTAYVAAVALLATGCTPNALLSQWKSVGYSGRPFERVLVLAAIPDPQIRRVYEDAFVQELAAMGVTATATHVVIQADGEIPEEYILQAVGEVHADGVLMMRMIGKEHKAGAYSPPPLRPDSTAELYAVYQSGMTVHTPPEPYGYGVYTLETSLWNATDQALVWSSTSQTFQLNRALAAAKDLADVVVKALRERQLL